MALITLLIILLVNTLMKDNLFHLKNGKRYRLKIGAYPEYSQWRYGTILSINNHSKDTISYMFNESVMNKKYPKKEYFGQYIWTKKHRIDEHVITKAEEIILFDTVKYLDSIAPKKLICERLTN
jgi:hypothetical protein